MADQDFTDLSTEGAIRIVESYLAAGMPNRIVSALRDHRSPESVARELAAERAAQPAARPAAPASGEPTPSEANALEAVIKKRLVAMYPKSGG